MITDEQIKQGLDKAYKESGHNAYFGNGFEAGVKFALEQVKNINYDAVLADVWQTSNRPFDAYPLGTKARSGGGGHWTKVERGWKWCTGSTFPRPGGDWDGMVSLPNCS